MVTLHDIAWQPATSNQQPATMSTKHQLGLIGYPLSHSFSKKYFGEKFEKENIAGYHYELFPIPSIENLPQLIDSQPNLLGLNITIPYKQAALPYLDAISEEEEKVGAVNTIKFVDGQLKGYNTDVYGFEISLRKLLATAAIPLQEMNSLVLGTGGAAKAVVYVLEKLGITPQLVSRSAKASQITYEDINAECMAKHQVIVNTTPLGMSPNVDTAPNLPYEHLTDQHFLYDLVYNPEVTKFLQMGLNHGTPIMNGLEMLYLQAEKSWSSWTEERGD
ncbi:MAG: shikimate dehydrogenase [Bacteroidota bacterium]